MHGLLQTLLVIAFPSAPMGLRREKVHVVRKDRRIEIHTGPLLLCVMIVVPQWTIL
jgi:hypothetical protein